MSLVLQVSNLKRAIGMLSAPDHQAVRLNRLVLRFFDRKSKRPEPVGAFALISLPVTGRFHTA